MAGRRQPEEPESLLWSTVIFVGLFCIVVLFVCYRLCRCCWRRACGRRQQQASNGESTVKVAGIVDPVPLVHLRMQKELGSAYLLLFAAGLFGAHLFYLDRLVHGVFAICTLNFFGLGQVWDLFMLPAYVRRVNGCGSELAQSDRSCRRVCWRLPLAIVGVLVLAFVAYVKAPRTLHNLGICDLDKSMAQTTKNPYELLGVRRDASHAAARTAYQERLIVLEECGVTCESKKEDLKKAFDFATGSWRTRERSKKSAGTARGRSDKKRDSRDDAWDDWSDFVTLEWKALAGR
mmetsp:Transcript_49427/g.107644  ORF Transcript_49427/g.107644 Transcript_49427/m.107644 type:complete len:291 (-) Transcript_49427:68-940(-)